MMPDPRQPSRRRPVRRKTARPAAEQPRNEAAASKAERLPEPPPLQPLPGSDDMLDAPAVPEPLPQGMASLSWPRPSRRSRPRRQGFEEPPPVEPLAGGASTPGELSGGEASGGSGASGGGGGGGNKVQELLERVAELLEDLPERIADRLTLG